MTKEPIALQASQTPIEGSLQKNIANTKSDLIFELAEEAPSDDAPLAYFGKHSRYGFSEEDAFSHAQLREHPEGNQAVKERLQQLALEKGIDPHLELSDVQMQQIHQAHIVEGELGKLSNSQLIQKSRILERVFAGHPKKNELLRLCLEAGFCGGFKGWTMDMVDWIKHRKERMRAMYVAISIQIFFILQTLDTAKSDLLHTFISLAGKLSSTLEKQAGEVKAMSEKFGTEVQITSENYQEIITKYQNYLQEADQYLNNSLIAKGLDRWYDGRLSELMAEAKKMEPTLENTNKVVQDMEAFLLQLHNRSDVMWKLTEWTQQLAQQTHDILDIVFVVANIFTVTAILYQSWFVAGEYRLAQKSDNPKKVKQLQTAMRNGALVWAISLITYFGYVNPQLQERVQGVVENMQAMMFKVEAMSETMNK